MPWWRARFSHSWGVLPTYFHTNPGQRMLEVREVQPPSRSCLLRGHSGDHGPSIMWTCCWEKNMKKTNKSNTCSSMIVSQMIKTACLPVLFFKKTCGFVWRAFNIPSNPHSIHYTPWNKHNTWQEFYSKKATFLFRAWFLSAATREFWRVFFTNYVHPKRKKKQLPPKRRGFSQPRFPASEKRHLSFSPMISSLVIALHRGRGKSEAQCQRDFLWEIQGSLYESNPNNILL